MLRERENSRPELATTDTSRYDSETHKRQRPEAYLGQSPVFAHALQRRESPRAGVCVQRPKALALAFFWHPHGRFVSGHLGVVRCWRGFLLLAVDEQRPEWPLLGYVKNKDLGGRGSIAAECDEAGAACHKVEVEEQGSIVQERMRAQYGSGGIRVYACNSFLSEEGEETTLAEYKSLREIDVAGRKKQGYEPVSRLGTVHGTERFTSNVRRSDPAPRKMADVSSVL